MECETLTQEPCGPDEKCVPYVSEPGYCCVDACKCQPVIGDRQFGELCERTDYNDDCARGLFCLAYALGGGTGPGRCIELCTGTVWEPVCEHGGECHIDESPMWMCRQSCDPLANDCAPDEGCYFVEPQMLGYLFICARTEQPPAQYGDPCAKFHSCAPGLACLSSQALADCPADSCCTSICDYDAGEVCPNPEEECVAVDEGYLLAGICRLP
jgi:hypothetical protein